VLTLLSVLGLILGIYVTRIGFKAADYHKERERGWLRTGHIQGAREHQEGYLRASLVAIVGILVASISVIVLMIDNP
jgi:hypothetical protein